ncbi:methyl-accepting chemotaxis protein [Paraburkholderia fungorum]|uniref:methyl-accepting chemotaxis protein n=1 Tax=Paraburkholderia fungorum TaxID=134537 RepID=UPI0038BCC555
MQISIKMRLAVAMTLLACLLSLAGILGLTGMSDSNEANRETYSNKLPSATYIGDMEIILARQRAALLRAALDPSAPDLDVIIAKAKGFASQSQQIWSQYLALPRTSEGDRLTQDVARTRAGLNKGLDDFALTIKGGDPKDIMRSALKNNDLYADFTASNDRLKKFLFSAAKADYDAQQQAFELFRVVILLSIAVGVLASAYSWYSLRRAIARPLESALAHFDLIAAGDLTHRVEVTSRDEMGQLMTGLAKMRESLIHTVRTVRKGSDAIALAAREVASGNLDLSARTEEQAASLEQTAASMEELTGTVKQNAENARQAAGLSVTATGTADKGSEVVRRVVDTMAGIDESSGKINDIISIIEGIAFQTNILALNAAVEAARAGEQGRGFAVVASEVRSLAQRSASAAKEIKQLIEQSVARVEVGTTLVGEAGDTMTEIIGSVKRVSDIMEEIAAATVEQSSGIDQVSLAVTQMDEVTQQNAALVEEASAAAQSLEDQARALRDAVAVFRLAD